MSSSRNRNIIIAAVIAAVVVIAAVIALVASSGGDDNGSSSDTTALDGAAETQPVTVVGDPLTQFDTPETDVSIGVVPPTLEGFAFDGSPMSITPGGDGRPKMVIFLAHWCPHCNAEIPVLIEWNESGGVPADLDVIGVSTAVFDDRDNYPPSKWIDDKGFPWPVMADSAGSEAALAYGVTGFPTFTLIDGDGTVLYRADGEKTLEEIEMIVGTFFPST
jgi:thiol-disulfide isomerase/thioredoxin